MQEGVPRHQSAAVSQTGGSSSFTAEKERFNSMAQSFRSDMKSFFQGGEEITDSGKRVIMQKIEDKLLDNKYEDIIDILKQNKDINILSIWDRKGLTLIHRMTLHKKINEVQFIIQYGSEFLKNNPQKNPMIKKWVNFQNEEGFTALHYASFKGDIEIIKYLMEKGAEKSIRNKNGLNVLHIAAQGDQPISLCYFDSVGIDLYLTDLKGGTALHWACYLGSENAVNYLVSKMKDQINTVDGEGLTPLHLAVISGNARVVKKLLQRGADRMALDHNKKTPAFLAGENEYHNIQQMLEKTGGFQEYCNIKQPFKPMSKNPRQLIVLFLMLFLAQGIMISFILPCFSYHYIELGIWAFFIIGTVISLLFAWRTNPGEVNGIIYREEEDNSSVSKSNDNISLGMQSQDEDRNESNQRMNEHITRSNVNNSIHEQDLSQNLIQNDFHRKEESIVPSVNKVKHSRREKDILDQLISLYQKHEVTRICVECVIVKPKRSRHCEICKKCIRVYDHHCPWINNCVGAQNYKFFITFILFMWFNMLTTLVLIFLHITSDFSGEEEHSDWIFNWYADLSDSTYDILKIIKYVASSLVIALTLFFFVLHTILCFVQLSNLFLNQTTFERYNAHQPQPQQLDQDNEQNQQNRRSSQFKSDQSSTTDANPSIIQSNRNANVNRNKLAQGVKKVSLGNAYTMCIENSKDPQYDYAPPMKNMAQKHTSRQNDQQGSGNLTNQSN